MARLQRIPSRIPAPPSRVSKPPKIAERFYLTPEWKALVSMLINERGRQCQACGREGCRIYADHITERKDGGADLDPSNIQLLCGSCHSTKTASARRARLGLP